MIKRLIVLCFAIVMVMMGIEYINNLARNGQGTKEKEYSNVKIVHLKGNKLVCKINNKNKEFKTVGKANKEYQNVKGTIYLKNDKVVKVKIIKKNNNKKENNDKLNKYIHNKNIRVILKTSGYSGIKHSKINIKSCENLIITYDGKKNQVCGKELNIDAKSKYFKNSKKISINVVDKKKGIKITSIKRSRSDLDYFGTLDVIKEGRKLVIVNEVNVEQYLYSVVPSEMPESFGYEALKVQAICARTYAYTHMVSKGMYEKYKAHVDDSISYQVYNNQKYSEETKKAVDDTKGMVLTYKDKFAKVFYYSTSCGYTSNTKDVFGGKDISYLKGKKQSLTTSGQINNEKEFKKFILSTDEDCFEKNCEWFRWKINWNVDKLTKTINSNLKKICSSEKNKYIYVLKNNNYKCMPVKNIGNVKSIEIIKRGSGGIVKEVVIKGSSKKIKVTSQNIIRQILAPRNCTIKKQNGSKIYGMDTLPSGYFSVEKKGEDYIITGGGFGHGVGMSQCGVFELVKLKKGYEEIIDYYFDHIDICKIK